MKYVASKIIAIADNVAERKCNQWLLITVHVPSMKETTFNVLPLQKETEHGGYARTEAV